MVAISMYSYLLQLPLWRYDRIPVVDGGQRSRSLVRDKRFPCYTDCPSALLRDHIAHVSSFQSRVRKSIISMVSASSSEMSTVSRKLDIFEQDDI